MALAAQTLEKTLSAFVPRIFRPAPTAQTKRTAQVIRLSPKLGQIVVGYKIASRKAPKPQSLKVVKVF
jgi:hypothetical protein